MMDDAGHLERSLEVARRHFPRLKLSTDEDVFVVAVEIRGAPIEIRGSLQDYPENPPWVLVSSIEPWDHPLIGEDRRVKRLQALLSWNRTIGIEGILLEIEQQFMARPPRRMMWKTRSEAWLHRFFSFLVRRDLDP